MAIQTTGTGTSWVPTDGTFGARLALVRQRMAWGNVKEAAEACGLPVESWRTWERDGVSPRRIVEVSQLIAERTGCSFAWLLTGTATIREATARRRDRHGHHTDPPPPAATRPTGRKTPSTRPPSYRTGARRPVLLINPAA